MFHIGLIEDDWAEASSVMLSLVVNSGSEQINEESFKMYELKRTENFREELFDRLIEDVQNNVIECLIVIEVEIVIQCNRKRVSGVFG